MWPKVLDAGSTGGKDEGGRLRDENQETGHSDSSFILHPSSFIPSFSDPGRPYFVMELVHGPAITAYCDQHELSIRQRLELFIPVCQAVQHAHQRGVIHRDIKPSNILVAEFDRQAVPKVIDFGVAKAIDQGSLEQTAFTRDGQIVGTPQYMSPEQARSSAWGHSMERYPATVGSRCGQEDTRSH